MVAYLLDRHLYWDPAETGAEIMGGDAMLVFALNESRLLGEKMATALGAPLAEHEEREFEDGEHKARPLVSVRGRDAYVIHSLHGGPGQSANDKICRLLFFLAAIREGGAARVTAVIPYLAYTRKDRQTKSRDPVTTRYMAQLSRLPITPRSDLASYLTPIKKLEANFW